MNTYQHQYAQSEQRRAQLLREAEAERLTQNDQPGLADRLLANVGEWMVTEGTRLKERQRLPLTNNIRVGSVEG